MAAEDLLYETNSLRHFAKLSLDHGIPDHTTIMNFRHLLERYELGRQIFEAINYWLEVEGILLKEGSAIRLVEHGKADAADQNQGIGPS